MPELNFVVRWPDGVQEPCYSPSTIVQQFFTPGTYYELAEFVERSRAALGAASERVRAKYGAPCSLALGQLDRIETRSADFADQVGAKVFFEAFKE